MIGIGNYRRSLFPRSEATGIEKLSPGMPAPPLPPFRYDYFAALGGGTGSGTFESPWSEDYVLAGAGGLIVPGKHVGWRGGQYFRASTRLHNIAGTLGNEIIHRNYNGEHVEWIGDSNTKAIEVVKVAGAHSWFWGIDAWRKHTDRYNYPGPGTNWYIQNASANGARLIHCFGHEGSNGVFTDTNIGNVIIYGCYFFHSGVSVDPRAHGFYVHHTRDSGVAGSKLLLSDCVSYDHLGNCGQVFGSGAPEQLDDIDILWLICWNGGGIAYTAPQVNLTFGGTDSANIPLRGFTARNIISRNRVGYGRANLRFYNVASTNQDAILEDCYLVGGTPGSGNGRLAIGLMNWSSFQARRNTMINLEQTQLINTDDTVYTAYTAWEDNAFFGSDPTSLRWRSGPGFTDRTWTGWKTFTTLGNAAGHPDTAQSALPGTAKIFIRPTATYEYGRSHVCIFNWSSLPRIPVDLSTVLSIGDKIVVRNAQDYWGATVSVYDAPTGGNVVTTWEGIPVYFPMDGAVPPPAYGFNNPALNAWVNPPQNTGPDFNLFVVSPT